jgi:ribosomal protein S18 acetylase RimI-like enzyme
MKGKLSSPVLRGLSGRKAARLPGEAPPLVSTIRAARSKVGPEILAMLADLASFEGAAHAPRLDPAALARDVFGPNPTLNILIAEQASGKFRQIDGFVSYFRNYSNWEGKPGIHLSDLWVPPAVRGHRGIGSALLRHVHSQNEGKRIDVFVVRDNEARLFYERLGFKEQTEWCLYRGRSE